MGKRKSNIRWRESDEKELLKAINNYNAKLYRFSKKHDIPLDVMPERIRGGKKGVAELKEGVTTRADLKSVMKSLQSIDNAMIHSTRGANISIKEYKVWKEKERKANILKQKERDRLNKLEGFKAGEPIGSTRGQMHNIKQNALIERNRKVDNISQNEFIKSMQALDKQLNKRKNLEQMKLYRDNYIKSLKMHGLHTKEIERYVMSLPVRDFADATYVDEVLTYMFHYTEGEHEKIVKQITNGWKEAVKRYKESKGK